MGGKRSRVVRERERESDWVVGQRRGEQEKTTATTSTSDLKVSDDRRKAERRSGRKQKEACASRLHDSHQPLGPRDPLALKRSRRRRQTWSASAVLPTQISAAQDMACDMGSFARVAQANEIANMLHRPILHQHAQETMSSPAANSFPSWPAYVCSVLTARSSLPSMTHHYLCRYCRKSWLFCT